MAKRYLKIPVFFSLIILLFGCRNIQAVGLITLGNFYFYNNRMQEADYCYLSALKTGCYRDIVVYNLGTVCFHLGESRAAMEVWEDFESEGRTYLDYCFFYNRGLLKYESGNYSDAFEDFKEALTVNPKGREAKFAVEAALERISSHSAENDTENSRSVRHEDPPEAATLRIFDYVKQNEVFKWEFQESQNSPEPRDW